MPNLGFLSGSEQLLELLEKSHEPLLGVNNLTEWGHAGKRRDYCFDGMFSSRYLRYTGGYISWINLWKNCGKL